MAAASNSTIDVDDTRAAVASATATNQIKLHADERSLRVEYCGGPTAAHGTLSGRVRHRDVFWEIARTPPREYDPLADAHEQPL